jgi:glutathione S-transferase
MKLFFSPFSPFARKVMSVAHELRVADTIEKLSAAPHPVNRDQTVVAKNPLGQVPTAILDDGTVLLDSRVIAEYLSVNAGDTKIFPADRKARFRALSLQAMADGLLAAAMAVRWELVTRPKELHWDGWLNGQREKVVSTLDALEKEPPPATADIGSISVCCGLGYLDLRFPEWKWREGRPQLAAWFAAFDNLPSLSRTRPPAA